MASRNQVVGQARIKIDGDLLDTDGQTTLDLGGPKREAVTGDYSAGDFRESTEPAKLDVSIRVKGDTPLASYRQIVDATVTIEFDNGQAWLMSHAYCADMISINQSEGKAKLTLQSGPAEQL